MRNLLSTLGLLFTFAAFAGCGDESDPIEPQGTGGTAATGATGGAGDAGQAGGAAAGSGGSGGTTSPGTSGLPIPPGEGGAPKPSGEPGGLTVLSWAGFQGAVSYTFDDTNSSQIANYAALDALGVPFTFYLITGKSEATNSIWQTAVDDGHEIGNHTVSHPATATAAQLDDATAFLEERLGITVWTMAAPMGDLSYASFAEERFLINRGVSNAVIAPRGNANPFNLPCYIPRANAPVTDFNTQIDQARTAGGWRVVLVHGFTGGSDGAYQPVALADFTESVEYAKGLGDLWLDTVVRIGAYFRAEKLFAELTPTSSGEATTWSWELPAHFPPGQYLRVSVEGGTLTQGGEELAWDDHGYYEIALDAGALTLSP